MTRSLLAITALLLSLTFTASEAPVTRVVKANALTTSALSVETIHTAPQQTEKHFLPVAELMLILNYADYAIVSLFAPVHPAITTELNNRGPPSIPS